MTHELMPVRAKDASGLLAERRAALLDAFLKGRRPTTLRAYDGDLRHFAAWCRRDPAGAVDWFFALDAPGANHAALAYRNHLIDQGLAAATVARRLAALRSLNKVARLIGACAWTFDVEAPAVEPYKDTRGPGVDGWGKLLAAARADTTALGRRDLAVVRLLHDLGLRRAELVGIDLADVERDEQGGCLAVQVLGKGREGRERLTLPRPTAASLDDWLAVRGPTEGPLFHRLDLGTFHRRRVTPELSPYPGNLESKNK
jgi:integrase/recombinase XerC